MSTVKRKVSAAATATDINGRFWLERGGRALAGRGRIELLERINVSGSIREAAKTMKMGYKAAWDAVDAVNRAAGRPVVSRARGGRNGGGTQLTPYGRTLVNAYRSMEREHSAFLGELRTRYDSMLALSSVRASKAKPHAAAARAARLA